MELGIDGLVLREPTDADAPAVVEAIHESMDELAPWMPWATPAYDLEMASAWIGGAFDPYRFLVVDADGRVLGSSGLNGVDEMNRVANLGYWTRTIEAGRGLATAMTRAVAAFGHREVGLERIEVKMSTRNGASRRAAEKAGATFEGTLRSALLLRGERHDAHVFSLLPGDR